ncbi:phosphoheptose isomerase family protein [Leptospira interrogans serovar Zanoni str. LT2156]|nr:phosphoheptose isomerase family protein [Leptospira interrogans serovar Zanoni str. LT2156]
MENFINPGDIAFGISSSGNSPNVINALLFAKEKGAKTIAMVGFDGGQALKIADMALFVPSEKGKYGIVEGVHEVIHHLLYEFAVLLEK